MSRRHTVPDPEWRTEAGAFINAFVATTKRDRYLAKPELLSENIAHDLERHLDSRRAIAISGKVHTSGDLIGVLTGALGSLDGGYCLVAGPYCPRRWRDQREIPLSDLVADQLWWTSKVLFSFGQGAAAYFSAEESVNPTRALLLANEANRTRMVRALDSLPKSNQHGGRNSSST